MEATTAKTTDSASRLGLWDTTSLIVGVIIGVGIFVTPGDVFARTTSTWQALLLWAVGGFLSLLGAFCFAELAAAYPRSGGEYVYLTRAYGRWSGFLFGWAQLAIIRAGGSIGVVAYAFARYSGKFFGYDEPVPWLDCFLAAAVVVLLTAVNIAGVRTGKLTQNTLTLLKVLGIAAILVVGFVFAKEWANQSAPKQVTGHIVRGNFQHIVVRLPEGKEVTLRFDTNTRVRIDGAKVSKPIELKPGMRVRIELDDEMPQRAKSITAHASLMLNWAFALIFVMWTYAGWHEAAYVAAEIKDPRRNIPRALMAGTGIVALFYVAMNLAYAVGLGLHGASATRTIAADVLAPVFGEQGQMWGRNAMALLVMLSCLGALNGMIFTSSRIYAEMGDDHPLFAVLGRWNPKLRTPVNALVIQGLLTAVFILFIGLFFQGQDGFDQLLKCTAAVFWLFFLLTGVAVFVLRRKDPHIERPFKTPLYPITPVIFCLCCLGMIVSSIQYGPWETVIGLGILAIGLPMYLLSRHFVRAKLTE